MSDQTRENASASPPSDDYSEVELTDADILDAMQHIPGYLDITTEDFRSIYHLAHRHALERLVGNVRAASLLRSGIVPLRDHMTLAEAASALAQSGYGGLPVVDGAGVVVGVLTETDFLRRLNVSSFLELLLRMMEEGFQLKHRCHETVVRDAMTPNPVTVPQTAGFSALVTAFHRHGGRSMPVVDEHGHLVGVLLRKDFLAAVGQGVLP